MDFGNIVGQLLQQGMSGSTQGRLGHALGDRGLGGQAGIQDILGQLMGGGQAGAGTGGSSGQGGLGGLLGGLMGGAQGGQTGGAAGQGGRGGLGGMLGGLAGMLGGQSGAGGMSNAQVGGIGALAGALLGGGGGAVKGALGGSAMAVLGTMAISALKNWQAGQAGQAGASADAAQPAISEEEVQRMAAPETAELCLEAMISAAKSDGQIQDDEMQRIVGKLEEGGITEEERRFVVDKMSAPLDLDGLVAKVRDGQTAAQVYAASLLAITVDTRAEQAYLQQLAQGLGLDRGTVQRLHQMVGA